MPQFNTGYKFPTIAGTISLPGTPWSNITNIGAVDSLYANVCAAMSAGVPATDYLIGVGFGFNFPANISARGIEIVYYRTFSPISQYDIKTCAFGLVSGINTRGNDQGSDTSWGAGAATVTAGGPTNLLGLAATQLSANLLNSPDFGIYLLAVVSGTGTNAGRNPSIDAMQLRFYWEGPYVMDVSATPEFGYEQGSLNIGFAITGGEYGFEALSDHIAPNPIVVHSQYGFETSPPGITYNLGIERFQMGYENQSVQIQRSVPFATTQSEYGFEAFSPIASTHKIIDIRSSEYGFEARAVYPRYFKSNSPYGRRVQREF